MKEKIKVLVIYDISDDRRRRKYMKLLNSFGYRVQESAYEAVLSHDKYEKLRVTLKKMENKEDSVVLYRLNSLCDVISYGDDSYKNNAIYVENFFV